MVLTVACRSVAETGHGLTQVVVAGGRGGRRASQHVHLNRDGHRLDLDQEAFGSHHRWQLGLQTLHRDFPLVPQDRSKMTVFEWR